MERAISTEPNSRKREVSLNVNGGTCGRKTNTTADACHTVLRYSIHEERNVGLFCDYNWGVFKPDEDTPPQLILVDAVKDRFGSEL